MEFHPERREEILTKRESYKLVKSSSKQSEVSTKSDSPLVRRLNQLHEMVIRDK